MKDVTVTVRVSGSKEEGWDYEVVYESADDKSVARLKEPEMGRLVVIASALRRAQMFLSEATQ